MTKNTKTRACFGKKKPFLLMICNYINEEYFIKFNDKCNVIINVENYPCWQ